MQFNSRSYRPLFQKSRNKLRLSILVLMISPLPVHSLGLGSLETDSYLGEQLSGFIGLVNAPHLLDEHALKIRQVSSQEAKSLGYSLATSWQKIDFQIENRRDNPGVKILSRKPVREPFLNILVELSWPNGKLYREYTVLLDPAPHRKPQALTQVVALPSSNHLANRFSVHQNPAPKNHTQPPMANTRYTVQRGDSLYNIAKQVSKSSGGNPKEWAHLIFYRNPDAFINNDKNRLMANYTLYIPRNNDNPMSRSNHSENAIAELEKTLETSPAKPVAQVDKDLKPTFLQKPPSAHINDRNQKFLIQLTQDMEKQAARIETMESVVVNQMEMIQQVTLALNETINNLEKISPPPFDPNVRSEKNQSTTHLVAGVNFVKDKMLFFWTLLLSFAGSTYLYAIYNNARNKISRYSTRSSTNNKRNMKKVNDNPIDSDDLDFCEERPLFATTTKPEPPAIAHAKDAVLRHCIQEKIKLYKPGNARIDSNVHYMEEINSSCK